MLPNDLLDSEGPSDGLNVLFDMELPLRVSLGAVRLPLGEVLELGIGSTLELNRLAEEPVDVIVNDRIVARGEVVVVEGNYGIRITEVTGAAPPVTQLDSSPLSRKRRKSVQTEVNT